MRSKSVASFRDLNPASGLNVSNVPSKRLLSRKSNFTKSLMGFTPFRDLNPVVDERVDSVIPKRLLSRKSNVTKSLTGFTLVEIILVVVIIGVLASLAIPRLTGRADRARAVAVKTDIESNLPTALDLYELDNGRYPDRLEGLLEKNGDKGPYLKKNPGDPWGKPYYYKCPGEHNSDYDLASSGKDGVLGNGDDVNNWK